jgi:protein-S-isoprenylcysteine O-methyltransferase Ste14
MRKNGLELRVPPLVLVLLIGGAMWLVAGGTAAPPLDHGGPRGVLAIAFLLIGIVAALAGVWEFRRAQTTVDPRDPGKSSALVTGGVYRFTRNPMYLGFLCLLLAWASVLWTPLALAGPVVFIAYMNRFQIGPEERMLSARFGASFQEYLRRVRRWV